MTHAKPLAHEAYLATILPGAHFGRITRDQFATLCGACSVAPCVALESDEVQAALRAGDRLELTRLLREEF